MKQTALSLFLLLILFSATNACTSSPPAPPEEIEEEEDADVPIVGKPYDFDMGKVENGVYTNTYFNCSMELPKDWVVQTTEQKEELTERSQEMLESQGGTPPDRYIAEQNTANLLAVFHHDINTILTVHNPSILMTAENVKARNFESPAEYMEFLKSTFDQMGLTMTETSPPETEWLNGKEFCRMSATLDMQGVEVYQQYLCTLSKGFAVAIAMTYFETEDKAIIDRSVKTLKFKK